MSKYNHGIIVRFNGRLGIVYDSDQEKEFKNKRHPIENQRTVLVTPVSETFTKLDEPKRIVKKCKLNVEGFVD